MGISNARSYLSHHSLTTLALSHSLLSQEEDDDAKSYHSNITTASERAAEDGQSKRLRRNSVAEVGAEADYNMPQRLNGLPAHMSDTVGALVTIINQYHVRAKNLYDSTLKFNGAALVAIDELAFGPEVNELRKFREFITAFKAQFPEGKLAGEGFEWLTAEVIAKWSL